MTQQNSDSGRTGIGDDDLDENGQPDATHDQSETGGSGGDGLTRHEGDGSPGAAGGPARTPHAPTESGALGAQDTRAEQAGANDTGGIGSAETGANQAPGDLAPDA